MAIITLPEVRVLQILSELKSAKPVYKQGETVTIVYVVHLDFMVDPAFTLIFSSLPGVPPERVVVAVREINYGPALILPFSSKELTWDQKDESGKQVPPGKYRAAIKGYETVHRCTFNIEATEEVIAPSWKLVYFG